MRLHSLFTTLFSLVSLTTAQQATLSAPRYPQNVGNWSGWGGNHYNNRWAMTNEYFNTQTIKNVVLHCQINSVYGVSATPTVSGDLIYFPTWNGTFVALNYKTCDIQWQINVTTIINNYKAITAFDLYNHQPVSRTSPQIDSDNGILYFGTQIFALLVAVDITNGNSLGVIPVNDHPVAQITASPTLYEGVVYASTSSEEEMAMTMPDYQCCSYIGNMGAFKFDPVAKTWTQLWNFETIGDSRNNGFHGAGIWGGQPSIDSARNQIFFASGNLYGEIPAAYKNCLTTACMPADVYQDSIFAVDLTTGKANWQRQMSPLDGWSFACIAPYSKTEGATVCPSGPGPDADIAMAPTFIPAALGANVYQEDTIVVGQKSGLVYCLKAQDGTVVWTADMAPANNKGGMAFGMAADDTAGYVVATNYGNSTWTLVDGTQITNGAFGAMNLQTGALVWQTAMPDLEVSNVSPSIVGDLMIAGTGYNNAGYVGGSLVAMNKKTGEILLDFQLDVVFHGGISFANEYMFVSDGYRGPNPTQGGGVYVFVLPQN